MNALTNKRAPRETRATYHERVTRGNRAVKRYLRLGRPARAARSGQRYAPGPHPTHKPHEVAESYLDRLTGRIEQAKVLHPGTLVKVKV